MARRRSTAQPPKVDGIAVRIRAFITEYTKDFNATQAAIRAGYSKKTARQQGAKLLTRLDVAAALKGALDRRVGVAAKALEVSDITADRLYLEAARIAFADLRGLYNERGRLRPVHEWPEDIAAAIAGVETVDQNLVAGDGMIDRVHKVKRMGKDAALKLLFQAKGLLVEKIEHAGEITYKWED